MSKPNRNTPSLPPDNPFCAVQRRKAVPHEFVLAAIAELSPETHPMLGCLAVYVDDKIVLILRDSMTRVPTMGCGSLLVQNTARLCAESFRI